MFEELEKRTGEEWSVHVSYMEIYQDVGFDLLNPGSRPGSLMVTLPKVRDDLLNPGSRPGSLMVAQGMEVVLFVRVKGSTSHCHSSTFPYSSTLP